MRIIYPEEVAQIRDSRVLEKIILNHISNNKKKDIEYLALSIDNINIFSASVHSQFILGLILEDDDNPYDYQQVFAEQIQDFILPRGMSFNETSDFEITTILLGIYIDIRRFADENLPPRPEITSSKILKIFLCGLDNAGKSTFVHFLKTGQFKANLLPTRRFNIEHVNLDGIEFIIWDMPGQELFRNSWLKGSQDSNLCIFMMDLADPKRWDVAKIELWKMLNRFELKNVPLLVLGNKLDLINGSGRQKSLLTDLELERIKNRQWQLFFTSIKEKLGISEALQWIKQQLPKTKLVF